MNENNSMQLFIEIKFIGINAFKVEKLKLNTLKIIDNKKRCLITIRLYIHNDGSYLQTRKKQYEKKEKKRIKK